MATAEVPLHGPATTKIFSLPMSKGPRKVAGCSWWKVCESHQGSFRGCLQLLPELQLEIDLQGQLRSPFIVYQLSGISRSSSPNAVSQTRLLSLPFQCSEVSIMKVLKSNLLVLGTEKKCQSHALKFLS